MLTCSAETGAGLPELWAAVDKHEAALRSSGELERRRGSQQVLWMWDTVRDRLLDALHESPGVKPLIDGIEADVRSGVLPPSLAADRILAAFLDR